MKINVTPAYHRCTLYANITLVVSHGRIYGFTTARASVSPCCYHGLSDTEASGDTMHLGQREALVSVVNREGWNGRGGTSLLIVLAETTRDVSSVVGKLIHWEMGEIKRRTITHSYLSNVCGYDSHLYFYIIVTLSTISSSNIDWVNCACLEIPLDSIIIHTWITIQLVNPMNTCV